MMWRAPVAVLLATLLVLGLAFIISRYDDTGSPSYMN